MENSNKTVKILLAIFVVLSLALGGFIVYDKILKKTDKPDCEKCENKDNTSTNNDKGENETNTIDGNNGIYILSLTNENQTINFGGKTYKIRNGSNDVQGFLYINDVKVNPQNDDDDYYVYAEKAYITNDLIIFTNIGQCEEHISYVIDKTDNEVIIKDNGYQIKDVFIQNGQLYATGYECPKETSYVKVSIKYENSTLTVSPME